MRAACLLLELGPPPTSLSSSALFATRAAPWRITRRARRYASTSSGPVTSHHQALTLIHKTRTLLPRTLLVNGDVDGSADSLSFWDGVLSSAQEALSSSRQPDAKARLAVYACDSYAGAQDLVASLLEDPFGTSPEMSHTLRNRWDTASDASTITLDAAPDSSTIRVSSAWLQQLPAPTQLVEIRSGTTRRSTDQHLLMADVPIVVWNPASSPLSALQRTIQHLSRFLLVVTGASNAPGLDKHIAQSLVHPLSQGKAPTDVQVILVDSARALSAVEALRQHPSSAISVQRFQDDFIGSGISRLHQVIQDDLQAAATESPSRPTLADIRLRTVLATLRSALNECLSSVQEARQETRDAYVAIDELKDKVGVAHARAHVDVLGDMGTPLASKTPPAPVDDPVGSALAYAERSLRTTLDRIPWWKLPYKADDVDFIMNTAIAQVWFRNLEQQLVMQTGRLAAIQGQLTASANALVSSFPPTSAFRSPVLSNTLAQLASVPSFPLTATSLTSPLGARQAQLAHPVIRLHGAAKRTVSGLGVGVFGSTGLGTAGWLGYLSTGPLAGFGAMEGPTALGVTAVGVLASARWAVGRWERAKRRWWEDWERVGAGVRRDLSNNLDAVMSHQVTLIPVRACQELETMVAKRKADIGDVKHELDLLEEQLAALHRSRSS